MTDLEFEIIDELYFIISFEALRKRLEFPAEKLAGELHKLILKGWVRAMVPVNEEWVDDYSDFAVKFKTYSYLATKQGLMAHNSNA